MQPNQPADSGRKPDHQTELFLNLQELKQWVSETSEFGIPHFDELGTRMDLLRDVLSRHFREEESGGYLKEPLEVAPRLEREAEELLLQHGQLVKRIDEFVVRLRSSEEPFASWQEAAAIFDTLIADVEQHEHRETALFQSAFEDDLGAGD